MSRIGNAPINIPKDVTIRISDSHIGIRGSKGEIQFDVPGGITVVRDDDKLIVKSTLKDRPGKALHGFSRATIANNVTGVSLGWTKTLELSGVGYRATMTGANIELVIGFSHPVKIVPPQGVTLSVSEGKIVVSGIDKQLVGQVAATIRSIRKPEPYKGKGIKYLGEKIRKKAGKAAKAIGAAPGGTK